MSLDGSREYNREETRISLIPRGEWKFRLFFKRAYRVLGWTIFSYEIDLLSYSHASNDGGMVEAREEDRSRNFEFESQSWWLGQFLRASSALEKGRIKKRSISRATICRSNVSNEFAESKRFFEARETEGSYFPPAWIYNSCIIRNDNETGMEKRIRVSKAASDYNWY